MVKANTGNQGQVTDVYEEVGEGIFGYMEWFIANGKASGQSELAFMMPTQRIMERLRSGVPISWSWLTGGENPRVTL